MSQGYSEIFLQLLILVPWWEGFSTLKFKNFAQVLPWRIIYFPMSSLLKFLQPKLKEVANVL
jgi:hypothetical protein